MQSPFVCAIRNVCKSLWHVLPVPEILSTLPITEPRFVQMYVRYGAVSPVFIRQLLAERLPSLEWSGSRYSSVSRVYPTLISGEQDRKIGFASDSLSQQNEQKP